MELAHRLSRLMPSLPAGHSRFVIFKRDDQNKLVSKSPKAKTDWLYRLEGLHSPMDTGGQVYSSTRLLGVPQGEAAPGETVCFAG